MPEVDIVAWRNNHEWESRTPEPANSLSIHPLLRELMFLTHRHVRSQSDMEAALQAIFNGVTTLPN